MFGASAGAARGRSRDTPRGRARRGGGGSRHRQQPSALRGAPAAQPGEPGRVIPAPPASRRDPAAHLGPQSRQLQQRGLPAPPAPATHGGDPARLPLLSGRAPPRPGPARPRRPAPPGTPPEPPAPAPPPPPAGRRGESGTGGASRGAGGAGWTRAWNAPRWDSGRGGTDPCVATTALWSPCHPGHHSALLSQRWRCQVA